MKSPERKARDAANMRAWRAANRERAREIDRRAKAKNPEAIKETKRRCYEKHREQNLVYAAAYREEKADQIKARAKHAEWSGRYRQRNPDKCRAMTQAWKDANPDRRKETQAAWSRNNLDKHRTYQHNRRARKAASGGSLSPDLAQRLLVLQRGLCACCSRKLGADFHMDHIVPLALGGSNTDDNIQLLTSRCNRQKGAKHPVLFMQSKGRLL